jgi:hypothetical protein
MHDWQKMGLDTACLIAYRRLTIKHGGHLLPQSIGKCCSNPSPRPISLDADRLAEICKALAHPVRIQILSHLKAIEQCVCGQLVEALPLKDRNLLFPQPNMSKV